MLKASKPDRKAEKGRQGRGRKTAEKFGQEGRGSQESKNEKLKKQEKNRELLSRKHEGNVSKKRGDNQIACCRLVTLEENICHWLGQPNSHSHALRGALWRGGGEDRVRVWEGGQASCVLLCVVWTPPARRKDWNEESHNWHPGSEIQETLCSLLLRMLGSLSWEKILVCEPGKWNR